MFLLRHGQSYFNLHFSETRVDPGIEDPELTPLGAEQAAAAARLLAGAALTRIIVSPYTRALQTAKPVLPIHRDRSILCTRSVSARPSSAMSAVRPNCWQSDFRITISGICRGNGGMRV